MNGVGQRETEALTIHHKLQISEKKFCVHFECWGKRDGSSARVEGWKERGWGWEGVILIFRTEKQMMI